MSFLFRKKISHEKINDNNGDFKKRLIVDETSTITTSQLSEISPSTLTNADQELHSKKAVDEAKLYLQEFLSMHCKKIQRCFSLYTKGNEKMIVPITSISIEKIVYSRPISSTCCSIKAFPSKRALEQTHVAHSQDKADPINVPEPILDDNSDGWGFFVDTMPPEPITKKKNYRRIFEKEMKSTWNKMVNNPEYFS